MALIVSLVLSMLGTLAGAGEPGVTVARCQRLHVGMPEWEVEWLFGMVGEKRSRVTKAYFRSWDGKDASVRLRFTEWNHRLESGSFQDASGKEYNIPARPIAVVLLNWLAFEWQYSQIDGAVTDTPGVTRENFERLACGMTVKEVERLFGTPGKPTWDSEDISVCLQFDQGRLIQGSYWDYPKRRRVHLR